MGLYFGLVGWVLNKELDSAKPPHSQGRTWFTRSAFPVFECVLAKLGHQSELNLWRRLIYKHPPLYGHEHYKRIPLRDVYQLRRLCEKLVPVIRDRREEIAHHIDCWRAEYGRSYNAHGLGKEVEVRDFLDSVVSVPRGVLRMCDIALRRGEPIAVECEE